MAWIRMPGVTGNVYVPEDAGQQPRKHPCPTCFACQWCDENRCQVCRSGQDEGAGTIEPADRQCCAANQSPVPKIPNSKSQRSKP